MSHLKEAIRSFGTRSVAITKLPEHTAVDGALSRLPEGPPLEARRPGKNYDHLAQLFLERARGDGSSLTFGEARDAAWCLWATQPALCEHPVALKEALGGIEDCPRASPARALAASYMTSYAPERSGIREASEVLVRLAPRLGRPWAALQEEYRLLHWAEGPERVAQRALLDRTSVTAVLRTGGLGALDGQSGFARACTGSLLGRIARDADLNPVDRLALVERVALDRGRLLFDEYSPLVAHALTEPFGDALPPRDVRDRYLAVLLALFKDPRLPGSRWARMPEAANRVRRWLTEQTLRQFLDVVDQVALERMWRYRRAFWEAIYRSDLISEAWVVFDPAGAQAARRAFGRDISFATFDSGVQTGQAVLLLRIGRGLVVEWSHNGKCIIYNDAEARGAPRPYQLRYSPYGLRAPADATSTVDRSVFAVSHMSPETYSWQRKVAAKLHQMTGVRIPPHAYEI